MTDSVDKMDPPSWLTRLQASKETHKSQKSAAQKHETDRDVSRPQAKPASKPQKIPSQRDIMIESYRVTIKKQNDAELTLPDDMFNFVVERQIDRLDILALRPIDEEFTAEHSKEGKEIETFFAANEAEMNKFVKKEDPNAYLKPSPGTPENMDGPTQNQSTREKFDQLMARSSVLKKDIDAQMNVHQEEKIHQQKRLSIQQAQSLKGQVGSAGGGQQVNAGKYGELLNKAKQIEAMAEAGRGTADFAVKQTKNLLQRQFEEAKAINQRTKAREMEEFQMEQAAKVRGILRNTHEKDLEENRHEKKQLEILKQVNREKRQEEEKARFYAKQVNKPDPFEQMQIRVKKKKQREEYKLVSFDYQQEKSAEQRQEFYKEAERRKLDSANEKMKKRQAKILAKDRHEMEKMRKRKGIVDNKQEDDFTRMLKEHNQLWGNEIQKQNEMYFEGKRNDKKDAEEESKVEAKDLTKQAQEADLNTSSDESSEMENQSTHYQDNDPRAIAAARKIEKDELREQQQEDLANSLSVII